MFPNVFVVFLCFLSREGHWGLSCDVGLKYKTGRRIHFDNKDNVRFHPRLYNCFASTPFPVAPIMSVTQVDEQGNTNRPGQPLNDRDVFFIHY